MKSTFATLTFFFLTIICFSQDSIPANYNGIQTTYHKNGNIKSQGKFVNGKREGGFIYYNDNGLNKTKRNFESGKQQGDCLYYLQQPVKADLIEKQIDGKADGEFIHYYKNGQVMETGKYINGQKTETGFIIKQTGTLGEKKAIKTDNKAVRLTTI